MHDDVVPLGLISPRRAGRTHSAIGGPQGRRKYHRGPAGVTPAARKRPPPAAANAADTDGRRVSRTLFCVRRGRAILIVPRIQYGLQGGIVKQDKPHPG